MNNASFLLITGASGGIGAEVARLAAADGKNLLLVARTSELLEKLADELRGRGVEVIVHVEDMSTPGSPERLAAFVKERQLHVDGLVNNAGSGQLGLFHEMDEHRIAEMITLNVTNLTLLTRLLLPAMIAQKHGYILNVASTAAFQPGPLLAVYFATKAYVLNWSLAIRHELKDSGIFVSCLCPGPTRTGFQHAAGMNSASPLKRYMDASSVAIAGYRGMMRNKAIVIPGTLNNIIAFCTRLIPRTWATRLAKKAQETSRLPS